MRKPKFEDGQKVFYRHVMEDPIFTTRVVEYINTRVASSRYDDKTGTYYYKICHPVSEDALVEVPEYDLFLTYAEAISHDRFL